MDPEGLSALGRIEAKLNDLVLRFEAIEAEICRWREILPDPDSIKGRIAKRRLRGAAEASLAAPDERHLREWFGGDA